jgi:hypothetical protein
VEPHFQVRSPSFHEAHGIQPENAQVKNSFSGEMDDDPVKKEDLFKIFTNGLCSSVRLYASLIPTFFGELSPGQA